MSADVFEFCPGNCPLVVSFPHSGVSIPPAQAQLMSAHGLALPDTDWHVPDLYAFVRELGASTLTARYSRYVVDLNRPRDGTPLYPGNMETSVCPVLTFSGDPIYSAAAPNGPDTLTRLTQFWDPYHRKLEETIDQVRKSHGFCLLWDAHSIRSRVPAFFEGALPDLNVGTADGRSCSIAVSNRILRVIENQRRFSFVANGRFKGGFITRRYGNPAAHVEAVQMELAQSAYMDEDAPAVFDRQRAADLAVLLESILRAALASHA